MTIDVVVPTCGRASLGRLLGALAAQGPLPGRLLLVDDRPPDRRDELGAAVPPPLRPSTQVLHSFGRGPAAARNLGWRTSRAEWIAFLDDDVVPGPDWLARLDDDLASLGPEVAATQGTLSVPSSDGPATDWERNVAGLARADFITADMAFRRDALQACRGFDERFPRAFREDAEISCRLRGAGWTITRGARSVVHPVPDAGFFVSVGKQRGNADDALMRALHGPNWQRAAHVPGGRRPRHLATTIAGAAGLVALARGHRSVTRVALAAWAASTLELVLARTRQGPRTLDETARMAVTSVLLPPVATTHWLLGVARWNVLGCPRPLPTAPPPR
jgi:hypothetical protein